MPADYLFNQRRRRTNTAPWAWDFQSRNPDLINAPRAPIEPNTRLFPNKAPGYRRAASYAYELAYRRYQPLEFTEDIEPKSAGAATQGRRDLPTRAPGRKAGRQAYEIRAFKIEGFAEPEELLQERRRLPDRTHRTRLAGRDAYVIQSFQVDLFTNEDELLRSRDAITRSAPGYRRASRDAYALPNYEVDLYQGSDSPSTKPPGQALFPDRQIVEDRAQYPERRQRRKVLPGRAAAPVVFPDSDELLGARSLLPQSAPGPRRANRTSYGLQNNPAGLYAPAAPTEFEELLGSRGLLPNLAPGARRAARDAYKLLNNQADLYAPPLPPDDIEVFMARTLFQDRVQPRRRRHRRKFWPGAPQATQIAEGALFPLLPERTFPYRRAARQAYQLDPTLVEFYADQKPVEILGMLLPDRGLPRLRAAREAYQLAPSLVEFYGDHVPEEVTQRLLPSRAPGRARAASRAYELRNSEPAFLGIFVPPATRPARLLLGVGL